MAGSKRLQDRRSAPAREPRPCFRPIPFAPPRPGDLPRLGRWLSAPEVVRWWGDPRDELELLRADLNEPRMTMRIVSFRGRAFAHAQDLRGPNLTVGALGASASPLTATFKLRGAAVKS